jgi:PHS family inorganic phosphate transporter-like MFS transporter
MSQETSSRNLILSSSNKTNTILHSHVRAVTVAGIGFFTDSYDIFAVNLITNILGMVFWQGQPIPGSNMGGNYGVLPTSVNTAIKAATSGGTVVGMMGFGWLSDRLGRRKMYGVELAIIVLATLAQSLAAPSKAVTMTGLIIFWRVVMGIGIGGDYPLSAVITSEYVFSLHALRRGACQDVPPRCTHNHTNPTPC